MTLNGGRKHEGEKSGFEVEQMGKVDSNSGLLPVVPLALPGDERIL